MFRSPSLLLLQSSIRCQFPKTPKTFLLRRLLTTPTKPTNQIIKTPEPPTLITSTVKQDDRFTQKERDEAAALRLKSLGPYVSKLPTSWIPYAELARLDKPVGTWLLYISCTWSILIGAQQIGAPLGSTLGMLAIFGTGALIMRGFGCTVNDLLDKNLDNKVLRTIERPIASGRVSPFQAKMFAGGQLAAGLAVILQIPWDCFLLGSSSLFLVCTYPLFKRFTYYPQAVLSLAFNWGALLGFPAMGVWDPNVMIPLFLSSFCWTMTYDTIYAHQDKKFDINAGIKSTALKWKDHSKKIFVGLTATQLSLLALTGVNAGIITGPGFIIGSGIFAYRLVQMIRKVDLNDPKSCWSHFTGNISSGLYFSYGLFFDYLLQVFGIL